MTRKIVALLSLTLLIGACGTAPSVLRQASVTAPETVAAQGRAYTLDEMGIGKKQIRTLAKAGITNAAHLLEAAKTDYGREKLVGATGIDPARLLELVNMADMMRVKGIGPGQSRLLFGVGVRTAKDLASRNPVVLTEVLAALNDEARLLERTPSLETVAKWVEEARSLDRGVTY